MGGCWVFKCTSRSERGHRLLRFPKDHKRRLLWAERINRKATNPGSPRKSTLLLPPDEAKICEKHFEDSCYYRVGDRRVLKPDAVPTLFLHGNDSSATNTRPAPKERVSLDAAATEVDASDAVADSCTPTVSHSPAVACDSADLLAENKSLQSEIRRLKSQLKQKDRALSKSVKRLQYHQKSVSKLFSEDQLAALSRRSTRGMKWETSTIKKALQLRFSCGDNGYRQLLSTGLPLPAVRTLQEKLQHIDFKPGVLSVVFSYLETKVYSFEERDKLCCLTLDEMQITPGIEFDVSSKTVLGDATLGNTTEAATHALVFMLGGVCKRWKQVVGYHYTGNSIPGAALKDVVITILEKAAAIGLRVTTVTSDMGPANRAMWREFGVKSTKLELTNYIPHPYLDHCNLYFMADIPHLVKNLRSAFVKHKVLVLSEDICTRNELACDRVCLDHVRDLISFQEGKDLKLAPKLVTKTIDTSHFGKMNVGNAMHLFSKSVSSALRYLVEKEERPSTYLTTAFFIESVNHWFDLSSSRHPVMALSKMKTDNYDAAISFLGMFRLMIATLQIGAKDDWKPVQSGVLLSTTSILHIAEDLLDEQDFLLTSRLTQDCLENLFSCVRSKNPVPTPREFKYALKVISVAQFLRQTDSSNYHHDDREYLGDLLPSIITPPVVEPNLPTVTLYTSTLSADEESSLYYIAGYCVQSLKKLRQLCDTCVEALRDTTAMPHSSLLLLKNYKSGALFQVRSDVFELMKNWELVLRSLEDHLKTPNVKNLFVRSCQSSVTVPSAVSSALPTCHPVVDRLLGKFVGVRLHLMCRKLSAARLASASAVPLGSRSAAQRHLAMEM